MRFFVIFFFFSFRTFYNIFLRVCTLNIHILYFSMIRGVMNKITQDSCRVLYRVALRRVVLRRVVSYSSLTQDTALRLSTCEYPILQRGHISSDCSQQQTVIRIIKHTVFPRFMQHCYFTVNVQKTTELKLRVASTQGGAESSVIFLLTENYACSFSFPLSLGQRGKSSI